ncbi:Chromosome segregation ATPase [Giardia duodenalis]|uniref:Chromosome segregation ATPase n=1 Tax=Giardia intestinalis TaxID=5741 RepID=V6TZR5_GIAIN|nr:Chromosome segregation ATPase [Giardia intestinalis]
MEDGSLDIKALKASTKRISTRLSFEDRPEETERISKYNDSDFGQKFVGIADESPFIDVKK